MISCDKRKEQSWKNSTSGIFCCIPLPALLHHCDFYPHRLLYPTLHCQIPQKLQWGFQLGALVWKQNREKDSPIAPILYALSAQKILQRTNAEKKMPIWRSQGFKGNKEALCYTWLGYNVPEEEQYSPKCILHFKSKPLVRSCKHLKHRADLVLFSWTNWHNGISCNSKFSHLQSINDYSYPLCITLLHVVYKPATAKTKQIMSLDVLNSHSFAPELKNTQQPSVYFPEKKISQHNTTCSAQCSTTRLSKCHGGYNESLKCHYYEISFTALLIFKIHLKIRLGIVWRNLTHALSTEHELYVKQVLKG